MAMRDLGAVLEGLHAGGRGLPMWLAFQGLAMGLTSAWFVHRSRGARAILRLCLLGAFAGALAGAALLGIVARVPVWVRSGFEVSTLLGGVVAYGALGGLALSFALFSRLRGVPALVALDLLAPCLGVLVVFGRLGCFFGGCDFGAITGVPWAVRFPASSPAFVEHLSRGLVLGADPRSLPVHPTQIYEVLVGAAMIVIGLLAGRRGAASGDLGGARPGGVFGLVLLVYAVGRLIIDELRGDRALIAWGPWTFSQWISAALIAMAALWWSRRASESQPSTGASASDERGAKER